MPQGSALRRAVWQAQRMPRIVPDRPDVVKAVVDRLEADEEVLSELGCRAGDPRLVRLAVELVTPGDLLTPSAAAQRILQQTRGELAPKDPRLELMRSHAKRLKEADRLRALAEQAVQAGESSARRLLAHAALMERKDLWAHLKARDTAARKRPQLKPAHGPDELYDALDAAHRLNSQILRIVAPSRRQTLSRELAKLIARVIEHSVARASARTVEGRYSELLRLLRERPLRDGTTATPIQEMFPHLDSPRRRRVAVCTIAIALGVMKKPRNKPNREKTRDELYDDRVASLLRRRGMLGKT